MVKKCVIIDKITVTEYEFYMDNRGGSSSTTTQYYEGNVPPRNVHEGSQYSPPQGKQLKLGEDFTFESPKKDIGNKMSHKIRIYHFLMYMVQ